MKHKETITLRNKRKAAYAMWAGLDAESREKMLEKRREKMLAYWSSSKGMARKKRLPDTVADTSA